MCRSIWLDLSTPEWHALWKQLCAETGAEIEPPTFWSASRVLMRYRGFNIYLSNIRSKNRRYTLVQTELPTEPGFSLSISRASVFDTLGAAIGMPRFYSGHRPFDELFVVNGSSDELLTNVLNHSVIRRLLEDQPKVVFTLREEPLHKSGHLTWGATTGMSILSLDVCEFVTDIQRLKGLFDLQRRTLDVLCEMGVAGTSQLSND